MYCSFYTQGANAENVYVDVPGTLTDVLIDENTPVEAGQPIIELYSQELRVQLASLLTESESARVRRDSLMRTASAEGSQ